MNKDWRLKLIDTTNSFATDTFLRDLITEATLATKPAQVLCRFYSNNVSICKDPQPPHHELAIIELIDTHREDQTSLIFLERGASNNRPHIDYFSTHPDSSTVLASIVSTLKEMTTSIPESISRPNDSETSIPLLPLFDNFVDEYEPLPESSTPSLPFFDAASLAGAKVAHGSMKSSKTKFYLADDRFTGSENAKTYMSSLHVIQQIQFPPRTVSLFNVVILAETVHQHAPLYSPLEDNCLWFIHIFCAVLEKLYACKTVHGDNRVSASQDIRIPRNNYLPNLAGRSMGILISKVEESIVSVVVANFLKFKEEMRADVQTKWEQYHHGERSLLAKVKRLESILKANDLDPNVDVDGNVDDVDQDSDSGLEAGAQWLSSWKP